MIDLTCDLSGCSVVCFVCQLVCLPAVLKHGANVDLRFRVQPVPFLRTSWVGFKNDSIF